MQSSDNTSTIFEGHWETWKSAILKYATSSPNKSLQLKHALREYDNDEDCDGKCFADRLEIKMYHAIE